MFGNTLNIEEGANHNFKILNVVLTGRQTGTEKNCLPIL